MLHGSKREIWDSSGVGEGWRKSSGEMNLLNDIYNKINKLIFIDKKNKSLRKNEMRLFSWN